jgi:hypothetical protein
MIPAGLNLMTLVKSGVANLRLKYRALFRVSERWQSAFERRL